MTSTPTGTAPRSPSTGPTTVRPGSTEEAAALLRGGTGPVLFAGAGTKQGWGGTPRAPELAIDTRGLAGLVDHSPADMTAAAQAGMPLAALQDTLAGHGQWLALDPPSQDAGATLGGLLASGESGPRRQRYGTLRDLVIGATVVLADGTITRTGGHVIKNVAGYDLTKLVHGSLGTLGLVTEVVLRLHPRPETGAAVSARCPVGPASALTLQLLAAPVEPSAITWSSAGDGSLDPAAPGLLRVRYDGRAAGVAAQVEATVAALAAAGLEAATTDDPDALWAAEPEAAGTGADGTGADGTGDLTRLRAGTRPSDLPVVAAALADAAARTGCSADLVSQCGVGVHHVRLRGPVEAQAVCVEAWRGVVLGLDGTVLVQDRPAGLDEHLDVLGPPPSAVALLRRVKERLDPAGRCAPGRFGRWY